MQWMWVLHQGGWECWGPSQVMTRGCLFQVWSHSNHYEASFSPLPSPLRVCQAVSFHLAVCRTFLNQRLGTRPVFILLSDPHIRILQLPQWSCTVYLRCTSVYIGVYPHIILVAQSSALIVSLSDFYTWFSSLLFSRTVSKWLIREKYCFGILKMIFFFSFLLIRQLFKLFPEAPFFVLPFGGDKPLSISVFYVLKFFFSHFCLKWFCQH